jgi:hypothetical protein
VCYSEQLDLFVASIGGYAYTSPDGMTFTKRGAIPVGSSATTGEMYFSNGVFLALSSGGLARSTDGMTWTKVISSAIGTKTPGCAHFVDGAWYMVVYQSLSGYLLRSVDNGLTWVQIFAFATTDIAHGMAFGGGTLIYVGTDVYVTEVDNGDGTTTTTEKYFASWTYCSQ